MAQGKEYEPCDKDRAYVRSMSAAGIPQEKIASCIGISRKTLSKHFPEELENAESELIADAVMYLKDAIRGKITREGVTAAIFIMKTRAGWRDTGIPQGETRAVLEPLEVKILTPVEEPKA